MKKIKDNRFILLTFLLGFTILLIVFIMKGMYPFGKRQIMIIDSWHQYFPVFKELQSRLTGHGSLLYSWNSGLGTNFITMIGYYAMSPLNILSVLCPVEYLREFFWVITLVKIALAGTFFSIYLKKLHNINDLSITVFGLLYTFSGFMAGYYWNIMWLDAVALLPLLILGLNYVVKDSKFLLYTIVLGITIFSNFYMAIFICIFIFIYFFVLYFSEYGFKTIRHLLLKVMEVAIYSILGIFLAGIALLPIFYGMSRAYAQSSYNPSEIKIYNSLLEIMNNLLIFNKATIVDGLPNIFSGILGLTLLVLFFMNKAIRTRIKYLYGGLLGFLLLSLNINMLDFAWHGFHFPNQVPYRFSFVVSFVIITMAYQTFVHINDVNLSDLRNAGLIFIVYLFINDAIYRDTVDYKLFYVSGAFILVYLLIFYLYKKNRRTRFLLIVITVFVLLEGFIIYTESSKIGKSSSRTYYYPNITEIEEIKTYLDEVDNDFYRMEIYPKHTVNDPIHYDFKGISQFASTVNANVNEFTKFMGMPSEPGSNTISYEPSTPALNGMFNVKYLISKNGEVKEPNEGYDLDYETEELRLLKNKFYLPLGFMVDEAALDLDEEIVSVFDRQTEFYQLATGFDEKFYKLLELKSKRLNNITIDTEKGVRYSYRNVDEDRKGTVRINYAIEEEDQYYLYFLNQNKDLDVTVNDVTITYDVAEGLIVDLGILKAKDKIEVSFSVNAMAKGYFDLGIVSFDEIVFEKYVDALNKEPLIIESFDERSIKGSVNAIENGYLYTSIPYEEGWKVKVNGEKVDTYEYQNALLAIPISKGNNVIEFSYIPKGLIIGTLMTLGSIFLIVLLTVWNAKKNKGEQNETGERDESIQQPETGEQPESIQQTDFNQDV